jgi:hypothetical protein
MAALIIATADQEPRAMDAVAAIIRCGDGAPIAARAAQSFCPLFFRLHGRLGGTLRR